MDAALCCNEADGQWVWLSGICYQRQALRRCSCLLIHASIPHLLHSCICGFVHHSYEHFSTRCMSTKCPSCGSFQTEMSKPGCPLDGSSSCKSLKRYSGIWQ